MKRIFACLVAIFASWSVLAQDTAIRYYPTYLGTLNGYALQATAMNNNGQVCGDPAFIYTAGVIQDLSRAPVAEQPVSPEGKPPLYFGPAMTATSINDEGNVVGCAFEYWSVLVDDGGDYFYTGETGYPAYEYSNGAIYDLGYDISNFTIGLYFPPVSTIPLCISDRDNEIIAGSMYRFGWPMDWQTNISYINPLWLNNQGHMAGWLADQTGPTNSAGAYIYTHACLANFSTQDLGTLGGSNSMALCLNASDQVVGWSLNNNEVKHAFFWSGGTMTDMGTLGGAPNDTSTANFINLSGQVIGTSTINSGQTSRAFLYNNGTMVDLNTLIVHGDGLIFTNATAINDSGQIISGSYLLTPFTVVTNVNVQFTASTTNGCSLLPVQFNSPSIDSGGYAITSWNWIFGDGSTSTLQNPVHTYTNGGNFTPILLATNVNNSPMLGYGPPTITVTNPAVQFTFTPTNGAAPLAVQFNCSSNDTAGYSISSWQWDFGDGTTNNLQNPLHTYTSIGTFNAIVTGTNSYGNEVIGSASITVTNSVVHFTANPTGGTWPLAVQFSCPSVDSAKNSITVWQWNFGDGSTSALQNPSHIYTYAGTFSPALVATNNLGNAVIASGPSVVTVTNPLTQWSLSEARPPSQNSGVPWSSLAISGDGNTLIAADSDRANFGFGPPQPYGLVYSSTNNGASWGESLSTLGSGYYMVALAASADGSRLFASGSEGGIYGSTNSGSNWAWVQPFGGSIFSSLQSSADGNVLFGATVQNGLCLSTNSGNSLTNVLAFSMPPPISLSPNGSNLFFWDIGNQEFFRSPETNWWMFTNNSSFNGWIQTTLNATAISALASSYDGSRVVAVGSGVFASTNSGVTWSTNIAPTTNSWSEVASSWDGMRIEIGGPAGLYNSSDGGNTWQSNTAPVTISQICCSSNATTLAGIGSDGAIYVFRNPILTVPPEAPLGAPVVHGTNFSFSCTLVSGHTYQAQSIGNLASTNWGNLGAPFVATSSSMVISDALTNATRFYRVKLVQ